MSPEQARGWRADHRSDIFSLGVVLFEMLTRRNPFRRSHSAETLQAIITADPPLLAQLTPEVPPALERIVARCLEKEPQERFQSALDLAHALRATAPRRPVAKSGRTRVLLGWGAALGAAILVLAARRLLGPGREVGPPGDAAPRADSSSEGLPRILPLTSLRGEERHPALSPDGRQLAFVWNGEAGADTFNVYMKEVASPAAVRLTTSSSPECCLTWSPDQRSIAFLRLVRDKAVILTVPALGGAERRIADLSAWFGSSLSWSPDGKRLAFSDRESPNEPFGVRLLPLEGGEPLRLTTPSRGFWGDAFAKFSPDGQQIAFSRLSLSGDVTTSDLYVVP